MIATTGRHIESVWVEVAHTSLPSNLLLGCSYRPPNSPSRSTEELFGEMEEALSIRQHVTVCGDININLTEGNHPLKALFLRFVATRALFQPITAPTRITNSTSSLLDIFPEG